jgi:hypothetical protein
MVNVVVNMRRLKPILPTDVRVDRATMFGNPYTMGLHRSREQAVQMFEEYALKRIATDPIFRAGVKALRGKRLFCWCAPERCHAEVLAKICEELNR